MVFPKARAVVAGALFVLWLGMLLTLVVRTRDPIHLARPQILGSNFLVIAKLDENQGRAATQVHIEKVLFAANDGWKEQTGQALALDEMLFIDARQGWRGPGSYLLPLTRDGKKGSGTRVTPLPLVPGYDPPYSSVTITVGQDPTGMAKLMATFTGAPLSRLEARFKMSLMTTVANVPARAIFEEDRALLRKKVADAGGRVEAIEPLELRIYRATDEVLKDLAVLRP